MDEQENAIRSCREDSSLYLLNHLHLDADYANWLFESGFGGIYDSVEEDRGSPERSSVLGKAVSILAAVDRLLLLAFFLSVIGMASGGLDEEADDDRSSLAESPSRFSAMPSNS